MSGLTFTVLSLLMLGAIWIGVELEMYIVSIIGVLAWTAITWLGNKYELG